MARKSARTLWAQKLEGKLQAKDWEREAQSIGPKKPFQGAVLGIDPSLRGTGLAVLSFQPGNDAGLLHSETIKIRPEIPLAECLGRISRAVTRILEAHPVAHTVLEETIYVQNVRIAQALGAARGAAIAAAALRGLPVFEYPPLRIKQAVVGYGRASKEQVIRQMRGLLNLPAQLPTDEADAAAAALCHALTFRGG